MMISTLSALGKSPWEFLHLASALYRSRPEEGISDNSSESSTGFSVIRSAPRFLIGLDERDLGVVEDRTRSSDEALDSCLVGSRGG